MATNSPQAGLPSKPSAYQLLERITSPQTSTGVMGPALIVANGECLSRQNGTMFRVVQNCGTVPVKFLIDNANDCTADNFHGVLNACVSQDDGTGGIINFNSVTDRVSILGVGGTPRVCTFIGTTPNYQQA